MFRHCLFSTYTHVYSRVKIKKGVYTSCYGLGNGGVSLFFVPSVIEQDYGGVCKVLKISNYYNWIINLVHDDDVQYYLCFKFETNDK